MGIIITSKEEVEEYFETDAISQSYLKSLLGGLDNFLDDKKTEKEMYYEEKGHFIIGSAVDLLLTGNQEDYDNTYHVSQIEVKPSDKEMSLCHQVFDDMVNHHLEDDEIIYGQLGQYPGFIAQAAIDQEWYKGKPGEKRTETFINNCTDYFEDLKQGHGKQILSVEQNFIITEIVKSLRENPRTAKYFSIEAEKSFTVDVFNQLPIFFNYKGLKCKALLDKIIVVKNSAGNVLTIEPIDLKTFYGYTYLFLNQGIKVRRYDIQAAWYTLALKHWQQEMRMNPHAVILPFKFIVESTSYIGKPLVYICDGALLEIGANGRERVSTVNTNFFGDTATTVKEEVILSREIKGYNQLIDAHLWYQETGWIEEKEVYESNGELVVDWNGIIL